MNVICTSIAGLEARKKKKSDKFGRKHVPSWQYFFYTPKFIFYREIMP